MSLLPLPWRRPKHPMIWFPVTRGVANKGGDELIPDEYHEGYVRGYRWWRIVNDGDGLALVSLHTDMIWDPEVTAMCRIEMMGYGTRHLGKSPDPDCSCGLYAQNPDHVLQEWERLTFAVASASGSILMSGRIIVCEKGYKAEHARIESPVLIDVACAKDCPNRPTRVELPGVWKGYSAFCPDHAPEYDTRVSVDADVWLRHACQELAGRYRGVEFISPSLLTEIP